MKNYVSASVLSANKNDFVNELKRVEDAKVDFVHFDVMDNVFVPNASFNDDTFKKYRDKSSLRFEVHLMVENPYDYIYNYEYSNDDVILIHRECFANEEETINALKEILKTHKAGITINPSTNVDDILNCLEYCDYVLVMSVQPGFGGQKFMDCALDKIAQLKALQEKHHYLIEVDGGINNETYKKCVEAGADILVSGSYLFKGDMKALKETIQCEK